MLLRLLLMISLLGPATASPITASPLECSQGSPEGCQHLQGPPTPAEGEIPSLKLAEPKFNSLSETPSHLSCDVCRAVVYEAHGGLRGGGTKEDVRSALGHACLGLPLHLQPECTSMVDGLAPLVTRDTLQTACDTLGVCPAQRELRVLSSRHHSMPTTLLDEENQGSFCNSCKKLLDMSANNLESRSTKRDILLAFKGGCSILPLTYHLQCNHFVTQYEPVLIESLKTMMEPTAICKKVGACHGPRNSDQCVDGPSYWCKSLETAKLCSALEHCRQHVWNGEQA
ncbi:PREDICTED: proactivator polypeptide-like 1 [Chrysochloris asiatica]|uniref:Proactivator polypeptide-like 1 n=1 Tax=Chrysochloris asiatica TaxID=185453 RepID=A0A9B0U353_CHRAS|nr:PREDICTED: proactivator polypeptide-like 1 [Chrysochloris asiatica]